MKKRFGCLILGISCVLFSVNVFAQTEAPVQTKAPAQEVTVPQAAAPQIEAPKGKTGADFGNEAKKYVQAMSAVNANNIFNKDKNTLFLDVRRRAEYLEDGAIEGSLDLSLGRLIFDIRNRIPHKDTPIITYCKKGMRAAIAGEYLIQMGYTNVKYLENGLLAWKNAGYPVVMSMYAGKILLPTGKTKEDFLREAQAVAGEGISPLEANQKKIADPNTVILDVALSREHALLGKIENSLLMEQGKVPFNIKKKIHDANFPIIAVCSTGKRALLTTKILKEMGYNNVTYIKGGLAAWKKAGLPTAIFVPGEESL